MRVLDKLFEIRINLSDGTKVRLIAYDVDQFSVYKSGERYSPTHHCITWGATHYRGKGKAPLTLWEPGETWDGIASGNAIDGIEAKEHVLSHLAMRPRDTDSDFFKDYTEAQLAFVEAYGDELTMVRYARYCDENGEPKRRRR